MPRPEGVWGVTQGRLRALARQESNPETMQWRGWNFNTDTRTRRHKTIERHRDMLARRESYSETMKRLEPRPEQCSLCFFDRIGLMFKVFKIQKLSLDESNEVFFSFLGFTAAAEWPSRWCCVASSSSKIGILCQTFEDNIHMIFGYLKLACLLTQWAQQVKNGRAIWS